MAYLARRSQPIGLVTVLVVAATLRLYRLDLIDFRFDQAYPLQYAQDIVRGYLWSVQPHGSVGNHPAIYLYVMALPYLLTQNFWVVAVYRILLDVAAVGLCWLIGKRYFNARIAFVSALLFSVGPWAIQFSRNFWPVPQPLFSCIALLGLAEIVQRKNPWGWAIAGLGLALTAGTHLGGLYVLPVGAIAYGLGRKSFKLFSALVGALPAVLIMGAYGLHDAANHFDNVRAYAAALGAGATFSLNPMVLATWLSGGTHLSDLTGTAFGLWQTQTWPLGWIDSLQVLLLVASVGSVGLHLAWQILSHTSGRDTGNSLATLLIVWLWLVVPVLLQLRSARPVMMQYLPVLLPAPFLLMAVALDWFYQECRKTLQKKAGFAIAVLISLIVGWQVYTTLHFTQFIEGNDTTQGYGLPVRGALAARAAALQEPNGDAGDVIVVIKGFPTPWNEQAAILRSVLADVPYRFLNSDSDGMVMRPGATRYIFAPGSEPLLQRLLQLAPPGNVQQQHFLSKVDGTGYTYVRLNKLIEPIGSTAFITHPNPVWANRVELVQYRVSQLKESMTIETIVRILEQPKDGADFHWFNRIFVGDRQVAQLDGAGVNPASWRAGDLVYMSFDVPLPSGFADQPTHIQVGSYTYPEIKAVRVSIPGQPPDDGVSLAIR